MTEKENWEGDERREKKRRVPPDRRVIERRKRYLFNVMLPTLVAVCGAGLISWGAYVTHITYAISAKFDSEIEHGQEGKDERMEMRIDYNSKIIKLQDTMLEGFKELRESNRIIYNLLVSSSRCTSPMVEQNRGYPRDLRDDEKEGQ